MDLKETRAVYRERRWENVVNEVEYHATKELYFHPKIGPPPPPPPIVLTRGPPPPPPPGKPPVSMNIEHTSLFRPAYERGSSPRRTKSQQKTRKDLPQYSSEDIEIQDNCTFQPKIGPDCPFVSSRTIKKLAEVVTSKNHEESAPPPPPTRRKSSLLIIGKGGVQYVDAIEEEKLSIELTPNASIYYYNPDSCPSPFPPVHIPLAPPLPIGNTIAIATKKDNRIKIVKSEKKPPPKDAPGGMGALLAELNAKLKGSSGGVQLKK